MSTRPKHLSPLDHSNDHPAVLVIRPFNYIHERSHEEDSAAVDLQKIFWICRVGYLFDIKSRPIVSDRDLEPFGGTGQREIDSFFLRELVTVLDRICDGLPDSQIDSRYEIVAEALLFSEFVRHDRRFLD